LPSKKKGHANSSTGGNMGKTQLMDVSTSDTYQSLASGNNLAQHPWAYTKLSGNKKMSSGSPVAF